MTIHFITHSSFLVEEENCCLLFDYFDGPIPRHNTDKPLYVFASHSHPDHFSETVFSLSALHKQVSYILSSDIFRSRVPEGLEGQVLFVHPGEHYQLGGLQIETLRSTDLGVAFYVTSGDRHYYHAGDLNCWVWSGAPKADNDTMAVTYITEIGRLAGKPIDVAFVPLDPRLAEQYDLGMTYFFAAAQAARVFPMHMWGDFSVIAQFKKKHPQFADLLVDIQQDGQRFSD